VVWEMSGTKESNLDCFVLRLVVLVASRRAARSSQIARISLKLGAPKLWDRKET
jgi:hypothetical protein